MKINEELYNQLIYKEKIETREKDYIRLCLKNGLCPNCGSSMIMLQGFGDYYCEDCNYNTIGE